MTPGLILFKLLLTAIPIYWTVRLLRLRYKDVPRMRRAWDRSSEHATQVALNKQMGMPEPDYRRWYVNQLQWLSGFAIGFQGLMLLTIWGCPASWSGVCNMLTVVIAMSTAAWSPLYTSRQAYKDALVAEESEDLRRGILSYLNRIDEVFGAAHVGDMDAAVRRELGHPVMDPFWHIQPALSALVEDGFVVNDQVEDGFVLTDHWMITEAGKGYVGIHGLLSTDLAGRD